ncbi:hydroxymethylbilane synthase [Gloeobacter violaceus]|uniref:Porphobilinogen deaminase n=1 Tax=Gloeobacter violaceus (strain ATCC 29082 / PCC 7421) TaxID=251221 RepID=HEM3_GLOVI|nr:hydroxymethylbilane synthase [Gloeobacter violaceus]Q7NGF7.1 RecName: Full=Porphobilinogen deaminase; Short=PBG; AltName: Full=Hydroxymethylbilane synthase; Short=HMBS; AltName: Full=Pre-uroporphyrinogen synthase [Gloeobacter violaceus PCC 7421]BAC91153.1 porphobilinogen deaminase [Gloeobacter violaceus PCC 7421]
MSRTVIIGSRDSQLALVQTHWVRDELQRAHPDIRFEIVEMKTQGDKILDVALAKIGDKGLFTKELESAMLEKRTDLAVHSLKDLPTALPPGLILGAITEREDPSDAVIVRRGLEAAGLADLPEGAVVGTSSLRRLAQLKHHYGERLRFQDIRGNLNTRLRKLDEGRYDAIVLAVAGMRRLGWSERISEVLSPDISLHAVGQGALGIECREADGEILDLLTVLNHPPTARRCRAERAMLRALEGGCQVPIGVYTELDDSGRLTLQGIVASLDGRNMARACRSGPGDAPEALGRAVAEDLKAAGAQAILDQIFVLVRSPGVIAPGAAPAS